MKLRALALGLLLGAAAIAASTKVHASTAHTAGVIPLCPPSNPNCGLNQ